MPSPRRLLACLLPLFALSPAFAQDLYDPATLRTFNIVFHDANWLTLLRQNYASETNILADLTVDGVTYADVGVRIRGNTSYTSLPSGSDKFSLKVDMDFVHADQEILGYDSLNLNNGFHDPTFSREVIYNNYVAQFVPNPRANNVLVTLNGQNWGVYNNVQQPDKRMLRDYFVNADGLRIRCANQPNGPGLAYNGTAASGYSAYEIQADGGLADPLGALIAVTYSLSNEPLASWADIDTKFAIDPSIWSVALENLLTDDDSYVNKGCDFMTYRDPLDGRMHLYQRDANETFTQTSWSPTLNFTATNKPVLSRVLAVSELRQRFMAHYRTARRDLNWDYFGPLFAARRTLLDAAVQADPKKLYSYTLFQNNFTSTVTLPYSGPAGGSLVGLQQFVTQRATFLNGNAELSASGPTISAVQASNTTPAPGESVTITATVAPAGSAVAKVELFYRSGNGGTYQRTALRDDGNSGDGAAGDGVYGAALPVAGTAGERVAWYVAATASNSYASMSFLPELTEREPNRLQFTSAAGTNGLRITEWMYAGVSGEFIELTNLSGAAIDLTGWSLDDDHATAGVFALGALGVVQPGESVVVTESTAEDFRTAWSLAPTVKILGQLGTAGGNNLGRADQIHLFNAANTLEDRLDYGDLTYPGSIRTQNASGQVPCDAIAQNRVTAWQLSSAGDAYGSWAASGGDLGTPGRFVLVGCSSDDAIFVDGFETL
ncbi:MAG TPA: CotH kinase family protein [Tahibacter sp.]|nr:CotH kinase family protein [Tahibacter sp.]